MIIIYIILKGIFSNETLLWYEIPIPMPILDITKSINCTHISTYKYMYKAFIKCININLISWAIIGYCPS